MNAIDACIWYTCLRMMRTHHSIELLKLNAEMREDMAASSPTEACSMRETTEREVILDHFEPEPGVSFRIGNTQRMYQMFALALVASLAQGGRANRRPPQAAGVAGLGHAVWDHAMSMDRHRRDAQVAVVYGFLLGAIVTFALVHYL